MVAHITGVPEPIYGREAHSAAMAQLLCMFPDIYVHSDPYPIQFGSGDWIIVVTNVTGTFTGEMVLHAADRDFRLLGRRAAGAADRPRRISLYV